MTTTEDGLLGAAVAGVATAIAGIAAAILAAAVTGGLYDDGTFLSGLIEAIVAGLVVLGATAVLTVVIVRHWAGRRRPTPPGWSWATLAVAAGTMAASVLWTAGGILADAVGDVAFLPFAVASPVGATVAAYGVLRAWAARAPSRGSADPPGPAPA